MNAKEKMIGELPGDKILGMLVDWAQKLRYGGITLEEFGRFLKRENPFLESNISAIIDGWQSFYKEFFGIELDFSKINIPEKQQGFDRLIVIAKGFTPRQVFEICQKNFPCWCYAGDLDKKTQGRNDREPIDHYAIWVRERREADEELKNLSAEDLEKKNIKGITLLERLLLELKFWDETGEHLDVKNITLCAGSRYSNGNVPNADWNDGRFKVNWSGPWDGLLRVRARVAVS